MLKDPSRSEDDYQKKKKKKKILNLEPKYQVDMTAPEKYMRAAILSGG